MIILEKCLQSLRTIKKCSGQYRHEHVALLNFWNDIVSVPISSPVMVNKLHFSDVLKLLHTTDMRHGLSKECN